MLILLTDFAVAIEFYDEKPTSIAVTSLFCELAKEEPPLKILTFKLASLASLRNCAD